MEIPGAEELQYIRHIPTGLILWETRKMEAYNGIVDVVSQQNSTCRSIQPRKENSLGQMIEDTCSAPP